MRVPQPIEIPEDELNPTRTPMGPPFRNRRDLTREAWHWVLLQRPWLNQHGSAHLQKYLLLLTALASMLPTAYVLCVFALRIINASLLEVKAVWRPLLFLAICALAARIIPFFYKRLPPISQLRSWREFWMTLGYLTCHIILYANAFCCAWTFVVDGLALREGLARKRANAVPNGVFGVY